MNNTKTQTLGMLAMSWVLAAHYGALITTRGCPLWALMVVGGLLGWVVAGVWRRVGEGI